MLPKSLRLTREEFDLYRKGPARTTAHFRITYILGAKSTGFGIIVPKKTVKGAVARHFLKRRIRAILRPWAADGRAIIVTARNAANNLTFQELSDELSGALQDILGGHA